MLTNEVISFEQLGPEPYCGKWNNNSKEDSALATPLSAHC